MVLIDASLHSIRAAFDLFLGRRAALARFDLTVGGFWTSFLGFLFCLPANFLLKAADNRIGQEAGIPIESVTDGFGLQLFDMVLDWTVFPLLLALIARPLGFARGFVPFIIVRNWAAVILSALSAVSVLPYLAGLASLDVTLLLNIFCLGVSLQFTYRIVRATLGVPMIMAIGLVVMDLLLSLMIDFVIASLAAA